MRKMFRKMLFRIQVLFFVVVVFIKDVGIFGVFSFFFI